MGIAQEKSADNYEALAQADKRGGKTLSLSVSGTHCAGCVRKIETALQGSPAVTSARLNFSTGRLELAWDGPASNAGDYVKIIESLGYGVAPFTPDRQAESGAAEERRLLRCAAVAGIASALVMPLAMGFPALPALMGLPPHSAASWVSGLIATPAVIYAGRPFFQSAWAALKNGHTNMDVPISVGVLLATLMSIFETLRGAGHVYFDCAVMLLFFLLIGRYFDSRARGKARSAASSLLQGLSGYASVTEGETIRRLPLNALRPGMAVSVAAGEKIPVDSVVTGGESSLDTALVTGETLPRAVRPGDSVYAGTINLSAPLTLTVQKPAENSLLADIVRLMETAGQGQARYVRLADRVARLYTPAVHILAVAAFLLWWGAWGAAWQQSLLIAITVLIITCPCALGLAVPVVQVLASGLLMKRGILVKSGDALERLASIDMILLDKTGTLTLGKPKLTGDYNQADLRLAASLARHSRHPLSQALAAAYSGDAALLQAVKEQPGKGLEAVFEGKAVKLGSRAWCEVPAADEHTDLEICLTREGAAPVFFHFTDQLKEDAAATLEKLHRKNLKTLLISGDRQSVADEVARRTGIDDAYGDLTPLEKFEVMEGLRAAGHKVLMAGDGLNDAPVLAGAHVSMAPGSAIDMAQNAADIVFMGDRLAPLDDAHSIAVFSQRLVIGNFAIAGLYNLIAVPLAFMGLVNPMVAALAMSASSLLVIANSFRLRLL